MTLPTYVPILKAMKSEGIALQNIQTNDFKQIVPLFEIPKVTKQIEEAARFRGAVDLAQAYLDEVIRRINNVWNGNQAIIDIFNWDPNFKIQSGEHILEYTLNKLYNLGVQVIPTIGYDRWGYNEYKIALENLELPEIPYFCLRLEDVAFDDSLDSVFFLENIEGILDDLNLDPHNCSVLIDFGDSTKRSLSEMEKTVDRIISLLKHLNFKFYITAGCSIPSSINLAVKNENSAAKVQRKEMILWQNKILAYEGISLIYGDYGVRGPNSNEGSIAPDANGKIRYTIEKHSYIVRGHSMRKGVKGEQMWALADFLVNSQYYKNPNYSWGDFQIKQCSLKLIKGGHSEWISIDTNHHLYFVLEEIHDFILMKNIKVQTI
ncbi:beta family protein [Acinetobacter bereziniae]|uniref:beta family protein n=1 Tax=Acinetobacter bereziniae TaxID=106648 RepID=UPI00190141D3|nr:beta family protein [Acinetobacter bereziniae]MBJ8552658.1 beta family protein [Acinetobacter bereziniae]